MKMVSSLLFSSLCVNRIPDKSKFQISNYEIAKLQNAEEDSPLQTAESRMHFVVCSGSITVKRCRHVSLNLSPLLLLSLSLSHTLSLCSRL